MRSVGGWCLGLSFRRGERARWEDGAFRRCENGRGKGGVVIPSVDPRTALTCTHRHFQEEADFLGRPKMGLWASLSGVNFEGWQDRQCRISVRG